MASHLSVPESERPGMNRLRSSSSPSTPKDEGSQAIKRPARPTHTRSRSYISPSEQKPTPAATFPPAAPEKPAETSRFPRLHLPGRHHHHHHHSASHEEPKQTGRGRHRYTQSEAQQYHKKKDSAHSNNEASGNSKITTTAQVSNSDASYDLLSPTSRGAAIPSLIRMASTRSAHRTPMPNDVQVADLRSPLRRRATSDPKSPTQDISQQTQLRPAAPKTRIEMDLERADHLRRTLHDSATEADLKRKDAQLTIATTELQDRFTTSTRSASDLMRRLDDAHDSLVRTTESLVDTISSFSNLSDQSAKLISNFEHESRHLDHDIRQRISRFRNTLNSKRSKRVEELEKRSQAASKKAEEVSRRLENCRTIVKNWEQRERNKRKAWRGVWVGFIWGVVLVAIAVAAGIASWRAVEVKRGNGTAMALLVQRTVGNKSYDVTALEQLKVPDDVKEVLMDIDTRARKGYKVERPDVDAKVAAKVNEEPGFRLLDEL